MLFDPRQFLLQLTDRLNLSAEVGNSISQVTHAEALEIVSQEHFGTSWRNVQLAGKQYAETLLVCRRGCLLIYDIKSVDDFDFSDGVFVWDELASDMFLRENLIEEWANSVDFDDPEERLLKETMGLADIAEEIDMIQFSPVRLADHMSSLAPHEQIKLAEERSTRRPELYYWKGRSFDLIELPGIFDVDTDR